MKLIIHSDGGSRGNPGPSAAGVVITDAQGKELFAKGYFLGQGTNNFAEYHGLLLALEQAAELEGTELEIYCDSELVVKQVNGEYRVKNAALQTFHRQIIERMADFKLVKVQHVRRSGNAHADQLVNDALDAGCDVENGSTHTTSPALPTSSVKWLDLMKEAEFDSAKPQKIFFPQSGNFKAGLLCLDTGQEYSIQSSWQEATITIIRGKGTITVNNETQPVSTGTWLQLNGINAAEIVADPKEQLLVLLTYLP
jgi:ribonuclease HI/quercetin dioxygenase-like cupin family protein